MNPPPLRYGATGSRINNSKGVDHQILPRKFASIRSVSDEACLLKVWWFHAGEVGSIRGLKAA
jgi:hypothetical protein